MSPVALCRGSLAADVKRRFGADDVINDMADCTTNDVANDVTLLSSNLICRTKHFLKQQQYALPKSPRLPRELIIKVVF